jgi:hypothetical protein
VSSTVAATSILILSLLLTVLYYVYFRDQPDKGVTTIIVGFSVLCVFVLKWMINRWAGREKKE